MNPSIDAEMKSVDNSTQSHDIDYTNTARSGKL